MSRLVRAPTHTPSQQPQAISDHVHAAAKERACKSADGLFSRHLRLWYLLT